MSTTETSAPEQKSDPPWLRSLSSWLPNWAIHDLREVSAAPRVIFGLLFLGAVGGAFAARWYYTDLYSERIAVLNTQLEALKPPAPRTVDLDMACVLQLLGKVTVNDPITVWRVDQSPNAGFVEIWGDYNDVGLPTRYRCEIVNRGTMTVFNAWLDAGYVFKSVVRSADGRNKGSGEILHAYDRSVMLPGAIEGNGGKRAFWVWHDAPDEYADVQFKDTVFVTDPDGRSGRVRIRMSGVVGMMLSPREAK